MPTFQHLTRGLKQPGFEINRARDPRLPGRASDEVPKAARPGMSGFVGDGRRGRLQFCPTLTRAEDATRFASPEPGTARRERQRRGSPCYGRSWRSRHSGGAREGRPEWFFNCRWARTTPGRQGFGPVSPHRALAGSSEGAGWLGPPCVRKPDTCERAGDQTMCIILILKDSMDRHVKCYIPRRASRKSTAGGHSNFGEETDGCVDGWQQGHWRA
jgi:hypothetical protein